MKKVRLGLFLIIFSWIPIAQILLAIAHNNHQLTSEKQSQTVRLVIWTLQFLIGLIGLWLVGKIAMKEAHKDGWKHLPENMWRLFKGDPTSGGHKSQ